MMTRLHAHGAVAAFIEPLEALTALRKRHVPAGAVGQIDLARLVGGVESMQGREQGKGTETTKTPVIHKSGRKVNAFTIAEVSFNFFK